MTSDAMFIGIIFIIAILLIAALRAKSMPIKLMSGFSWFMLLAFINNNAPASLPKGGTAYSVVFLIIVGIGLITMFWAFSKSTNVNITKGNTVESSESNSWHMPSWISNMNPEHEEKERQRKRVDKVIAYRERVHTVLNQRRNRR